MQHEYCLYSDITWSECYDMSTKYGDFWDKSCPNAGQNGSKNEYGHFTRSSK